MARASDVRVGQVWEAKVSGKLTKVEILGEAPPKPGSTRRRFSYRNLSTGRTATGTAGKLRSLSSSPAPQPAQVTRRPPSPRRPAPETPLARPSLAKAPEERGPAREIAPPSPRSTAARPPRPSSAPGPLRSLRSEPRTRVRTKRRKHSSVAESAANAIQKSGAKTVHEVLKAAQAWAHHYSISNPAQPRQGSPGTPGSPPVPPWQRSRPPGA